MKLLFAPRTTHYLQGRRRPRGAHVARCGLVAAILLSACSPRHRVSFNKVGSAPNLRVHSAEGVPLYAYPPVNSVVPLDSAAMCRAFEVSAAARFIEPDTVVLRRITSIRHASPLAECPPNSEVYLIVEGDVRFSRGENAVERGAAAWLLAATMLTIVEVYCIFKGCTIG